jgi:hypothetical protein
MIPFSWIGPDPVNSLAFILSTPIKGKKCRVTFASSVFLPDYFLLKLKKTGDSGDDIAFLP